MIFMMKDPYRKASSNAKGIPSPKGCPWHGEESLGPSPKVQRTPLDLWEEDSQLFPGLLLVRKGLHNLHKQEGGEKNLNLN